jgi:hypothetical protein
MGGGFKHQPSPNPGNGRAPASPAPRPAPGGKPATTPARPGPGSRPVGGGGSGPGNIKPRPTPLPVQPGGRPGAGDIGRFVGGHPPGHFPGTPGHRPGYSGYHKAEFNQNIHVHFPYHPAYGHAFSKGWCAGFHWPYRNWHYWGVAATPLLLTSWIGVASYTGYGAAEQVPYYPYEPAPAATYDARIAAPVQAVEDGQNASVSVDAEWMNIGVFGIIPYRAKDFAYAVQLSTTKDGSVRGIQWDMAANTQVEVVGSIQKDSLHITWQASNPGAFYFETNIDELTQQESMVNVYDPTSKSLVSWQLIQIDEKDLPQK